jgi:hypothetical protein
VTVEHDIPGAFRFQAGIARELGSPFVAKLCELFAERLGTDGPVGARLAAWSPHESLLKLAVPLRIVGALHALVLEGRNAALAAVFPPNEPSDEVLWHVVSTALAANADFILVRLASAPQTNEVRRAAILLPAFLSIATRTGLPLVLSEVGASAGLNLLWDRFGYRLGDAQWGDSASPVQLTPKWRGTAPPMCGITIRERAGCDVEPIDPGSDADCLRLLSYVWADQRERLERTRAALEIARHERLHIAKADAGAWLARRLAETHDRAVHVVFHTIVWDYLEASRKAALAAMIRDAGAKAAAEAPLAWLRFEPDSGKPVGGAVTLTLWPGGGEHCMARADFHGRWIDWRGW